VLTRVPAAGDPHAAIRREPLQQRAAAAHLARLGRSWRLRPEGRYPGRLLIKAGRASRCPPVSIVIPTRDQGAVVERCLRSIYALTDYPDFEVVVVDNRTVDGVAKAAFARFPVVHVRYDEDRFNYSAANNLGVSRSRGELVLFLNNDTEIVEPDWLRDLVLFFEDPEIGAIGPTLLYPNGAVQHAGVVLGSRGTADHAMRHLPGDGEGPDGALVVAREVSAVTAACLMTPRRLFDELGGFSTDYAAHYQDLDLCLKIRRSGRRIISAGFPRVVHHESLSRGGDGYDQGDRALLIDAWREVIAAGDPYYHPRLDLARLDFTPAA
jgi:GT2 family glycosyltransferase